MLCVSKLEKKPRTYIEHSHQKSLFEWSALARCKYPELELLCANRNTQRLTKIQAIRAKNEGMKAGWPDVFLPVARGQYHGLYIELKKPDLKPKTERGKIGGLNKDQQIVIPKLRDQGYKVDVCYGWDEAKKALEEYLVL